MKQLFLNIIFLYKNRTSAYKNEYFLILINSKFGTTIQVLMEFLRFQSYKITILLLFVYT